jgi:pimeloyl-ACP methyl ester carboxylesterase
MHCWPELERYGKTIDLPGGAKSLFLYDSAASGSTIESDAFPIILIHGLGDEADTWRHLFPLLARTHRVIAPDLPGFGRSAPTGRMTLARHADALQALLRKTGKAILVGNSLGGAIAELVSFRESALVAHLILIDGGLPTRGKLSLPLLASLIPGVAERGYRAWRKVGADAYGSLAPYYAALENLGEKERDFLRLRVQDRVASDSQCRAYCSSFRSYLRTALFAQGKFARLLARSRIPLLVIWGDTDRIIPIAARESTLAVRHDATVETILQCGHLPQQEKPIETHAAIERFLASSGQ